MNHNDWQSLIKLDLTWCEISDENFKTVTSKQLPQLKTLYLS
jgi:hypothetical protein